MTARTIQDYDPRFTTYDSRITIDDLRSDLRVILLLINAKSKAAGDRLQEGQDQVRET
jgi:hypothetical protein